MDPLEDNNHLERVDLQSSSIVASYGTAPSTPLGWVQGREEHAMQITKYSAPPMNTLQIKGPTSQQAHIVGNTKLVPNVPVGGDEIQVVMNFYLKVATTGEICVGALFGDKIYDDGSYDWQLGTHAFGYRFDTKGVFFNGYDTDTPYYMLYLASDIAPWTGCDWGYTGGITIGTTKACEVSLVMFISQTDVVNIRYQVLINGKPVGPISAYKEASTYAYDIDITSIVPYIRCKYDTQYVYLRRYAHLCQ